LVHDSDAVRLILESDDGLGNRALRAALGEPGYGGSTYDQMVKELKQEDPPRVHQVDGQVIGADGKRRKGKPWIAFGNRTQPHPRCGRNNRTRRTATLSI
jgi:hypothetical protein